jgi:hypothetical protein
MTIRRVATLALLMFLLSCGGGSNGGDLDAFVSAEQDTTPPEPGIDTVLSTSAVKAGGRVDVQCTGYGFNPETVWFVVRVATPDPEGDPEQDPAEEDLEGDEGPDPTMPEGVTRDGGSLRFNFTGDYTVACYAPDKGFMDETAAPLVVSPGSAVRIETVVEPTDLKAGEWANLTCEAWDAFGNEVTYGLVPQVSPSAGVRISGLAVQFTKIGTYDVACAVQDTAIRDSTPEKVTVTSNVPKKIRTIVQPSTFQAGGNATVSCEALDYYDNPVKGLPLSVYLSSPFLELRGTKISSIVAGSYTVKCVPQNIEWDYFQLQAVNVIVTPADPTELELKVVPRKLFYGKNETIKVTTVARDVYGNFIADAPLSPVAISPPVGIEPSSTNPTEVFVLREEGIFRLTFRLKNHPTIYKDLDILVEGSGPLLTVLFPERGATLSGKPSVTVVGTVNDDVTGVSAFDVWFNGESRHFDCTSDNCSQFIKPDGKFTYILNPRHGLNVFHISVTNGMGLVSEAGRGFYFTLDYLPVDGINLDAGMVDDGVRAFLGRDFIDDGDRSPPPNDLASIIETVLASLNIGALIPNPVAEAGSYKVTVSRVTYAKPTVEMRLYDGGMNLRILIANLSARVEARGKCEFLWIDWCPDVSGEVKVRKVHAITNIDVKMGANKKISAEMKDVQMVLEGLEVKIDGLIGSLFNWLIDAVLGMFEDTIRKALEQQIAGLVNDTIEDLFAQFQIQQTFDLPELLGNPPTSISILTRPSDLQVKGEGIWLDMEATLYSLRKVSHRIQGSFTRAGCLIGSPESIDLEWDKDIALAARDDLLNQALYAAWFGGTLNLKITQDALGDIDELQGLVENLVADLDFYLPPILTDCGVNWLPKQGHEGPVALDRLQLQVGDLYVEATLDLFGNPLELGLFVQVAAEAELKLVQGDEGPEVAIVLNDIPLIDIEVVSINPDFPLTIEQLMDILNSQVLDTLLKDVKGTELVSFAIPAIDLGSLDPSLPAGMALTFALEELNREYGFTMVRGHLE